MSQKVTKDKDPKRVDPGRKGRANFMKKMKEDILNDVKKGGGDTTNSSNEITSPTKNPGNEPTSSTTNSSNKTTRPTNNSSNRTARSNNTYIHGVGIVAVLAIGVCVFFAYNTFQPKNKKQANEKEDQRPKRRHML